MVDFSIAIRTYNGAKRLPEVLDKLKTQVGVDDISWEIVIINNNSTDDTIQIIQQYQSDWPHAYPIEYYFEPKQGASFARKRAIQEAQGFLIGFLDDDNIPADDWVASAYSFGKLHPKAGAYGSQIHGDFEVKPPENFQRISPFFPIIEREELICFNFYKDGRLGLFPPGAGLVIRKKAWLESVPSSLVLQGPIGNSLAAKGEDIEALSYIKKAGWEIWFNPEMKIIHKIPKTRFERDYLLRFFRGIGLSRHHTRMLKHEPWQQPLMIIVYMLNDFRKLIFHSLKYGISLGTDLVAVSEREFILYSIISPFYFWQTLMRKK